MRRALLSLVLLLVPAAAEAHPRPPADPVRFDCRTKPYPGIRWCPRAHYDRRQAARPAHPVVPGADYAHLERIARCESGGDPRAYNPAGPYLGAWQFLQSTWESVGGRGDPRSASRDEQLYRAARLYALSGPGQWPVCQYR
jgi:hypothetical protein